MCHYTSNLKLKIKLAIAVNQFIPNKTLNLLNTADTSFRDPDRYESIVSTSADRPGTIR